MECDLVTSVDPLQMPRNSHEAECLDQFHELMKADDLMKHLTKYGRDDVILMSIRAKEFDLDRAFQGVKTLVICITEKYPELFARVDSRKLMPIFKTGIFQVIRTDEDSPVIITIRIKMWIPSLATADDLIAAAVLLMNQLTRKSIPAQDHGVIIVYDMDGFGFSHARQINYDLAAKISFILTYASPIRFIEFIHINSHVLFEKIFNLVKYVIPEKARKQVHVVRKDLSPIHNLVPDRSKLPVCLGGDVPNVLGILDFDKNEDLLHDASLPELIHGLQREFGAMKGK